MANAEQQLDVLFEAVALSLPAAVVQQAIDAAEPTPAELNESLRIAASKGAAEAAATLLAAGADPEARSASGNSSLHFAARSGSSATALALLQAAPALATLANDHGDSPLMFAARADAEMVGVLLARGAGAGIDDENADGSTALAIAILAEEGGAGDDLETVGKLLAAGADVTASGKGGKRALRGSSVAAVRAILQRRWDALEEESRLRADALMAELLVDEAIGQSKIDKKKSKAEKRARQKAAKAAKSAQAAAEEEAAAQEAAAQEAAAQEAAAQEPPPPAKTFASAVGSRSPTLAAAASSPTLRSRSAAGSGAAPAENLQLLAAEELKASQEELSARAELTRLQEAVANWIKGLSSAIPEKDIMQALEIKLPNLLGIGLEHMSKGQLDALEAYHTLQLSKVQERM